MEGFGGASFKSWPGPMFLMWILKRVRPRNFFSGVLMYSSILSYMLSRGRAKSCCRGRFAMDYGLNNHADVAQSWSPRNNVTDSQCDRDSMSGL